jgi:ABC-type glycerol-3-phosphate transport system substrate-binding protein
MPFLHLARAASAIAALALAAAAGGCGSDGDDRLEESSLRECLAAGELEIERPGATAAGAALGNASPDFSATTPGGVEVDVIVTESDRAAERTAADVRAALLSFGVADAEIVNERNAVAVVTGGASADERGAIEDCLGA